MGERFRIEFYVMVHTDDENHAWDKAKAMYPDFARVARKHGLLPVPAGELKRMNPPMRYAREEGATDG